MVEESGSDFLYLLGHLAWRLVQAAAVTAGVIAVIMLVMPGRGHTKEKAYLATMKSDLRNLLTVQEAYFADHGAYAPTLDQFPPVSYWASAGVMVVVEQATPTGWKATATHNGTKYRCAIFVGDVPPPRKQAVQAEPICWKP